MGFLDRMVADLIADNTGLPVRRLVRRVGAKNLLLLGGAAVAGGLAYQKMREGQTAAPGGAPPPPPPPMPTPSGSPRSAAPPPPPPPPESTPAGGPPPPPPAPPSAEAPAPAEPTLSRQLEVALARTMVAAALADGRLEDAERTAIAGYLDDAGLDPADAARIHNDLLSPASPEQLADLADGPGQGAAMVRAALLVLAADGGVGAAERGWLERLAAALGLPPDRTAEIERDLLAATGA